MVRLGLVPGGGRLPAERELAELLGISRVTLREVLKVLQDQGLIEARRGRYGGTFVLTAPALPTVTSCAAGWRAWTSRTSCASARSWRSGAAGLCAARGLDDEGADRLRTALAATREAPLPDYRRMDTLFHLTLAELSGSPSLAARYAAVRASVNDLLDCIPLLVRNLEHSQHQHTALVAAVLDGDEAGARAVMREHCAGTAALLRGFLA